MGRETFLGAVLYLQVVDDDDEEGRGQAQFSLQRWPEDVFGANDSDAKLYPVTELDPYKVGYVV